MNEKAATIVAAIEFATRHMRTGTGGLTAPPLDPTKPWGEHCSALFRETMRQIAYRGKVHVPTLYTDEKEGNANVLGTRIRQHPGDWERITNFKDVQAFADSGRLVVGSYVNSTGSGHLGFIYPSVVHRSEPLVRDGNIHPQKGGGLATSTYGAVPVHRAFGSHPTMWFKYRHY
jgi:hypothetical protein